MGNYTTMMITVDPKGYEFMLILTYIYGGIVGGGIGFGFIAEMMRYIYIELKENKPLNIYYVVSYIACITWGLTILVSTILTGYYDHNGNTSAATIGMIVAWSVFLGIFLIGFVISFIGAVGVRLRQCFMKGSADDEELQSLVH